MAGQILVTCSDCYKEIAFRTTLNAIFITAPMYFEGWEPRALLLHMIKKQ